MKYLGIVKKENGTLAVPDSFKDVAEPRAYEAVQVEETSYYFLLHLIVSD